MNKYPRSAYVHIPFCHRRCFYCDFAVIPLGNKIESLEGNGSKTIKEYLNLSKQHNLELIELALAFCNQRKFMGSVIFGSTSLKQLKLILSAIKLKINEKVINEINSIYKNNPLTF